MNRRLKQPSNIDQLPQLTGLVKYHGFHQFASLLEKQVLYPSEKILIPLIQGTQPVAREYTLLPDGRIDGGIFGKENPKKFLQGADWYYKQ